MLEDNEHNELTGVKSLQESFQEVVVEKFL